MEIIKQKEHFKIQNSSESVINLARNFVNVFSFSAEYVNKVLTRIHNTFIDSRKYAKTFMDLRKYAKPFMDLRKPVYKAIVLRRLYYCRARKTYDNEKFLALREHRIRGLKWYQKC